MEFNTIYHVFNHANAHDNLFDDDSSYDRFLTNCKIHILPVAEILAYCLMPNHFHLLIKTKSESEILKHIDAVNLKNTQRQRGFAHVRLKPEIRRDAGKYIIKSFSNCFNAYAKYFNIRNNRKGSLFLKNFNRKKVWEISYLKKMYFYIHINPIKHQFRRKLEDWRYSSFKHIINNSSDILSLQYLNLAFKDVEDFKSSLIDYQSGKYPDVDIDDIPTYFKSFNVRF